MISEQNSSKSMRISVVIPTYRRPDSLYRCLVGLTLQTRPADEVLVVSQRDDEETHNVLAEFQQWTALKAVSQARTGAVNQYNAGLDRCLGDVIAITDDDSVPRPDWLTRIEHHFMADSTLGGVGGRDFVYEKGKLLCGNAHKVGVVQWFGRIVGNHHVGSRVQEVDILKGVNMSFRNTAIGQTRFDTDLRGKGAQTCLDMAFSFSIKRRGWRLLFDPEVAVDHFPASRFDPDQRGAPSLVAIEENAFNFYLTLRRHLRPGGHRHMALCWAWLIGVERTPGIVRGFCSRARGDTMGISARSAAVRAWRSAKQVCLIK